MSKLTNPFSGSKTEVDTAITERKYDKMVEDGSWVGYELEDENEYYMLWINKQSGFGTVVRKKFKGHTFSN